MRKYPTNDGPLSLGICEMPPKVGPEIYILRLKASQLYTMTICSEKIFGLFVHWNGRKSEPHFEPQDRCPSCLSNRPKRWKGFLHCFCHELGQEVFLELTPASAHSIRGQLGKDVSFRGNRIQVKRGKGDNARLIIAVLAALPNSNSLPAGKDPLESIMALWGLDPAAFQPPHPGDPGESTFGQDPGSV